jgi:hypothetical protein
MRAAQKVLAVLTLYFLTEAALTAQQESVAWGQPDERLFIESKWRYTYTLHLESNTIVHKADKSYDFFLYFRYDYTYQESLNGKLTRGNWSLDGRTLFYSFQHVNKFEIVQLSKNTLVLEFTQRNSKGAYQYHFVRVDSKDAPFVKPSNELPEVIVEAEVSQKGKEEKGGWLSFRKKKPRKETEAAKPKPVYINVELIGGGFYGGIDPVIKDFIHIKSDGRLIKEFQSVNEGLHVTKKNISREELEQFAEYVVKQKFFNYERVYDCSDQNCFKRKGMKPAPIPLRIAITYGDRKKVVTIAIWGKDDLGSHYVDYPPALDNIIDAIQRMANRLDEQVVRK